MPNGDMSGYRNLWEQVKDVMSARDEACSQLTEARSEIRDLGEKIRVLESLLAKKVIEANPALATPTPPVSMP